MQLSTRKKEPQAGPKRKEEHHSYDESIDETAKLLEDEPVDIEQRDWWARPRCLIHVNGERQVRALN